MYMYVRENFARTTTSLMVDIIETSYSRFDISGPYNSIRQTLKVTSIMVVVSRNSSVVSPWPVDDFCLKA